MLIKNVILINKDTFVKFHFISFFLFFIFMRMLNFYSGFIVLYHTALQFLFHDKKKSFNVNPKRILRPFPLNFAFILTLLSVGMNSFLYGQTTAYNDPSKNGTTNVYLVPAGVTIISVQCWGAGGGGSSCTSNNRQGGGGGGGAYASSQISVTPGTTYNISVGAGGAANSNGGNSTFNGLSVVAAGGSGGTSNSSTAGLGGTVANSTGTVMFAGGNGANGNASPYSGGGGGVAGSSGSGGNASGATGGTGTPTIVSPGGNGGAGVTVQNNGNPGINYGGGGSGAIRTSNSKVGGVGAGGYVSITVVSWCPPVFTGQLTNASCPLLSDGVIAVSNNMDPAIEFRKQDNDYIDLNASLLSNLTQFTIEGWTKFNLADDLGTRVGGIFGQNDCIEFGFYDPNTIQCWTYDGGQVDLPISKYPNDNAWHHIAATGNGTTLSIYVDGILAGSGGSATGNYGNTTTATTKIGGRIWDNFDGGSFTGQIKKVGFWNKALTQAQITALASSYYIYSTTDVGLIAGYNFFEGTGTVLSSLPAGHNGSFVNTPVWTNIMTYAWTKTSDGTYTRTTPNISALSTGQYNLTVSNGSCTSSNSFTVGTDNTCATYWTGSTDSDWNKTSNWTAQYVPLSGANVEFATSANSGTPAAADLIVDTDRTIGSLKNLSAKRLFIPAGKSLTVNTTVTTNNDPKQIYIQTSSTGPGGSLIFHNAVGSPLQATVEMYSLASWNLTNPVGGKYKWQFFGVPVQAVTTASPLFDGAYVREMHENDTPAHWFQLNNASGLFSFKGYEITQSVGKTYVFQGALENRDYTVTMPYTSTASYPGESLIGNSYTAAIDIKKMVFGSQMLATVYLYNTGSQNDWLTSGQHAADSTKTLPGQYTAIPFALAGNAGLPSQIPSMQAFIVRARSASVNATLSIPYSSALTMVKNTTLQRAPSGVKSEDPIPSWTQVDVTGSRFSDRMWLFTVPGCTHGFDNGFDGEKFTGSYIAPQIYAMEEDGDYQVNSVDDINNTYLGFQPGEDSTYTLTFTHVKGNSNYRNIYLMDSVSHQTVDITASGSAYTFQILPTDTIIKRFKIITTNDVATSVPSVAPATARLNVFSSQNTLFVDNKTDDPGRLILCDATGRIIQQLPFKANQITTLHTTVAPGIYVVKATTKSEQRTVRLLLK